MLHNRLINNLEEILFSIPKGKLNMIFNEMKYIYCFGFFMIVRTMKMKGFFSLFFFKCFIFLSYVLAFFILKKFSFLFKFQLKCFQFYFFANPIIMEYIFSHIKDFAKKCIRNVFEQGMYILIHFSAQEQPQSKIEFFFQNI